MRCEPAPWLQVEAPRWGMEKPPDREATERIRRHQSVAIWSSARTVWHGVARCGMARGTTVQSRRTRTGWQGGRT